MIVAVAASLFAIATAVAAREELEGQAWLRTPPNLGSSNADWTTVPAQDAYELVASREDWAVSMLEAKPIVPVSDDLARSFAGDHFVADAGKKPYLVRAVCGHGATGGYSLSRRGKQLW